MSGEHEQMIGGTVAAEPASSRDTETRPAEPSPRPAESVSPNSDPERDIRAAIEAGDYQTALTLCVRQHAVPIGRLCMAMLGSQAEADDILQETLLAAHDGFGGFKASGTVRAWLFGIARNKCLHHLEKQRRQQSRLRLVAESERPQVEDVVLLKQRAARARQALESVKPTEREALLLRYVGQLRFDEVALVCGVDEATARKRVSRALMRLRSQLGTEG